MGRLNSGISKVLALVLSEPNLLSALPNLKIAHLNQNQIFHKFISLPQNILNTPSMALLAQPLYSIPHSQQTEHPLSLSLSPSSVLLHSALQWQPKKTA